MAEEYHLDYKNLFLPQENLNRMRQLSDIEESKNYHLLLGYTDVGAFLTPLSIYRMQQNIKNFRKAVFDSLFNYCAITEGLDHTVVPHINKGLKTYLDMSQPGDLEVVLA